MSSLTSGSPGIRDTGSGNAAYISGLVMMDVMMSWRKGILVRCCLWDRPFYISSLLLGTSCRAYWRVTTLVLFDYLFNLLCLSCLFVMRGLKDLCVVAAGTVRCFLSSLLSFVLRFRLIAALRCWYRLSQFLSFLPLLYFVTIGLVC